LHRSSASTIRTLFIFLFAFHIYRFAPITPNFHFASHQSALAKASKLQPISTVSITLHQAIIDNISRSTIFNTSIFNFSFINISLALNSQNNLPSDVTFTVFHHVFTQDQNHRR